MSETITNVEAAVNGGGPMRGDLEIWQDVQYVRSERAVKPDLRWAETDAAGHRHAYADDGSLPTLRMDMVHVDCAGGCGDEICEGYDEIEYRCSVCNQVIEPATVPDVQAMTTGIPIFGLRDWSLRVYGSAPWQEVASVEISNGGQRWSGQAMAVAFEMRTDGDGFMDMVSASPLAEVTGDVQP